MLLGSKITYSTQYSVDRLASELGQKPSNLLLSVLRNRAGGGRMEGVAPGSPFVPVLQEYALLAEYKLAQKHAPRGVYVAVHPSGLCCVQIAHRPKINRVTNHFRTVARRFASVSA